MAHSFQDTILLARVRMYSRSLRISVHHHPMLDKITDEDTLAGTNSKENSLAIPMMMTFQLTVVRMLVFQVR